MVGSAVLKCPFREPGTAVKSGWIVDRLGDTPTSSVEEPGSGYGIGTVHLGGDRLGWVKYRESQEERW